MSRIDRNARPTRYTNADYARMLEAQRRYDEQLARTARNERRAFFACLALCIGAGIALFYVSTGGF